MKTEIKLIRKGWVNVTQGDVSVWVRGQAHLGDVYYDTKSLAELFVGKSGTVAALDELVSSLNGCWAVVVKSETSIYAAVDRIRSIQLLYVFGYSQNELVIFDDVEEYRKTHTVELDEDSCHEYLSIGYVYSDRTLYQNMFSLQAAERVAFSLEDGKWHKGTLRYWKFIPVYKNGITPSKELLERVDDAFLRMAERLIESVDGRRIVIPLSGGYDSRIIANYLHRLGYKNVLCYTYGNPPATIDGMPNQPECSRRVASALGYDWHFTEYTNEKIFKAVNDSNSDRWFRYAANGVGMPVFQEYFALGEMSSKKIVNLDDIIVPGYDFDFPAGSCIMKRVKPKNLISEIMSYDKKFFQRGEWRRSYASVQKLIGKRNAKQLRSCYEMELWQETSTKFIKNSVRCFEWFGFDWRLPEWDNDLIELWMSLPVSLRYGRRYFKSVWPLLAEPEIRECPIFRESTRWEDIKHGISSRIPYRILHIIHWLRNKGECTPVRWGATGIDMADVMDKIKQSPYAAMKSIRTRIVQNLPSSFKNSKRDSKRLPFSNMSITLKSFGLSI